MPLYAYESMTLNKTIATEERWMHIQRSSPRIRLTGTVLAANGECSISVKDNAC